LYNESTKIVRDEFRAKNPYGIKGKAKGFFGQYNFNMYFLISGF
jgi:hypothetical protein